MATKRSTRKNTSLLVISDDDTPVKKKPAKKRVLKEKDQLLESKTNRKKAVDEEIDSPTAVISDDDDDVAVVNKKPAKKRVLKEKDQLLEPKAKRKKAVDGEIFKLDSTTAATDKSIHATWEIHELLADYFSLDADRCRNIVRLFEGENTIPFICRYRKEVVGEVLTPEKMRDIKSTYSTILELRSKIARTIQGLEKRNLLSSELKQTLLSVRNMDELELVYAPYVPTPKKTLAERACALGLENPAKHILHGTDKISIESLVKFSCKDLDNKAKVKEGLCHIISNMFGKNVRILEEIRNLQKIHRISIQVKKSKTAKVNDKADKFQMYFDYNNFITYLKPHQTLAINRGENLKILSVKILVPDSLKYSLQKFIEAQYLNEGDFYKERNEIFQSSFDEAFSKKFQPFISRKIRSDLTKNAEKASINVFATNLKQLLLMSPVKGEKILGMDPGFKMGCKCALINECQEVLETFILYPLTSKCNVNDGIKLGNILAKYDCSLIALGNGTGCRETEQFINTLFENNTIDNRKVRYCIVSEQGASIYSCSPVAKEEFPDLDVSYIGAISIARRLGDPLCELVKVEPKHLGVGMYQHDVTEKHLSQTLKEVVSECVSFVGVDINTASASLLENVAGLTAVRAKNIIQHRNSKGPFRARKELTNVKMIGEKTFQQCAGFIKIEPETSGYKKCDIFDRTWIHPESYEIAERIIGKYKLSKFDIGTENFIKTIKTKCTPDETIILSKQFHQPEERVQAVFDALQRDINRDFRIDFDKKPMFKKGLTSINDLFVGAIVTGAVTNLTHFGCFVDIGVGHDALIHTSAMQGFSLEIGNRVEAKVLNIDISRRRIGLSVEHIL